MSYQVLARKYRPKTFDEVIGQDHIVQTLKNAFAQDRISHAYLFSGPRGVGKTTTARILAKALNCLKNSDGTPCGECQNCTEISTSRSMDVLEIDGASNRGIDEIRNLREVVKYPPVNAKYKVFIIDEVHMLTTPAFNALLKTLEEPPPHIKFIFATTEPNKITPTILSRCQRHDFHRMSIKDILKGLDIVIHAEKIEIDDKSKQTIASQADGSMRDALSLLDQIIAFAGSKIEIEQTLSLLGIIPSELYFQIGNVIRKKDRVNLLELLHKVFTQGYSVSEFVSGLSRHFLNLLISRTDSSSELLELSTDLQEKYSEEAPHWDSRDLLRYNDQLVEMERNLKLVQQPRIYLESVMLKLVELDPSVSLDDLITRLSGSASKLSSANNPGPTQTFEKVESKSDPAPVVKEKYSEDKNNEADENPKNEEETEKENSSISLDYVKEKWDDLISKVGENGTSLSTFLSHGKPTTLKGKKLFITIPRKYRFQTDVLKKNSRKLEITFEKELGVDLRMNFILSKKKDSEQDDITKHPVTQRMVDLFGGEIIK